jgi:hypothetical protein
VPRSVCNHGVATLRNRVKYYWDWDSLCGVLQVATNASSRSASPSWAALSWSSSTSPGKLLARTPGGGIRRTVSVVIALIGGLVFAQHGR